jgi:hypothetical protein
MPRSTPRRVALCARSARPLLHSYDGLDEVRAWRAGPAVKYTYTTDALGQEPRGAGRHLVTVRLRGNFPGGTVDLRCDFAVIGDLISRLVIAL